MSLSIAALHRKRRAVGLLLLFTALMMTACSGGGAILVGHPEVFTRSRLLNRRLTEKDWLEDQLAHNTPTGPTFQGLQDIRTFSGLYNKTAATFDPLAGK